MQPTSDRPQVHFAEPTDASFDAQLQSGELESSLPPVMARSGGDISYEAIALVVMGAGLFILAIIIVIARAIKSKSQ